MIPHFCFGPQWLLVPATGKINFHRSEDFPLRNKAWKIIPRAFLSLRILSCYFFSQVILWLASNVLQKSVWSGQEHSCSTYLSRKTFKKCKSPHLTVTRNQRNFKGLKIRDQNLFIPIKMDSKKIYHYQGKNVSPTHIAKIREIYYHSDFTWNQLG